MSNRRYVLLASLLALLSPRLAVAADTAREPSARLTLYHWLQSPAEARALGALTDLFKSQYPGVAVKALPTTRKASGVLPAVEGREESGASPDSFMMHVGYAMGMFRSRELLSSVDDIWTAQQLEGVTPPVVRTLTRIGDHYYAVPLNVHRTNLIWYNPSVLQKNGIDPATLTTWPAFFDAAKKLRDQGMRYPITIGADWIASNALECVIASEGIATYEDWINGKLNKKDDPRLTEAIRIFLQYLDYASNDLSEWDQALKSMVEGRSAFFAMGDWTIGEFNLAGLQYGKDYGVILVPGTKGMFGVTVDAFSRPGKVAERTNSDRWLKLVASREGEDAFCLVKGCIPARTDATINRYPEYQKSAIADFRSAKSFYPNLGAAVPMLYHNRFDHAVADMRKQRDAQKAAAALAEAASATSDGFALPWSLK